MKTPPSFGFTLVELIATIMLVGLVSTVVAPHFDPDPFRVGYFKNDLLAHVRLAQKLAASGRREVRLASGQCNQTPCMLMHRMDEQGNFSVLLSDNSKYVVTIPEILTQQSHTYAVYFDAQGYPLDADRKPLSQPLTMDLNGLSVVIEPISGLAHVKN